MKTIDFLPDIYRQREALRRARIWWAMVVMIFGGAIGASSLAQAWLRLGLVRQLDSLSADYDAAQKQVQELATLQTEITRAGHEAGLYTFLDNPWPRTQLMAAVVRPLPESIRLAKIVIAEEEQVKSAIQVGPRNTKADEEAAAKASNPEKDMTRLQDEAGRRQTAIEIEGYTSDVPKLHEYVAVLSQSPLIASATPKSLEASTTNQQTRTRFQLRLIVRPGYAQRADSMAAAAGPDRGIAAGGGQ